MMIESGADGVFFWWYPGGFRLGENSDFGIINPDGTDRPVTKVIRTEGPRFLARPSRPSRTTGLPWTATATRAGCSACTRPLRANSGRP